MSTVRDRENSRCYSGRPGISIGQSPAIQARIEFSAGTGAAIPPAVHAAALEASLFESLKLNDDVPSWSAVVADPTSGKMSDTVHGALLVYDLPDLVESYRSSKTRK